MTKNQIHKDDNKITLYKRRRAVGEVIQLYEDADGAIFIKTGNFYREIEINDDGHLATMLGRAFLVENVRIEYKKYGREPESFA